MNRDQLQQQVECPICMEQFRTPKQLPCQHSFCLQCLQNVHKCDRGHSIRCPECRLQHRIPANGIAGFPTSVVIQRFLEAMNQPNVPQQQNNEQDNDDSPVIDRHSPGREISAAQQQRGRNETPASHIPIVPDDTWRGFFQSVRQVYRKYIGHLLRIEKRVQWGILSMMLIITFLRFIAGAAKLSSDCHDEYNVAVYSFVKAWLGFFLYGTLPILYCTTDIERALNNKFVQIWFIIHALFTVIWFLIGTVWLFGKYAEMTTECPKYVDDWNYHFINFILFLTALDLIGTVAFVFFFLYWLCDDDNAH